MDFDRVAIAMRAAGAVATIRGEGGARFVFADSGDRAVEISACDCGVWVEYWAADNESPVFDRTFPDDDAAVEDAARWLGGSAAENSN